MHSNKPHYLFIPKFSFEPDKLSLYNEVLVRDYDKETLTPIQQIGKNRISSRNGSAQSQKIVRSSHNFTISDNAYRTLKKKINWLYYLAKSRHVKTYSGKEIFNFKINFLTLTLPSKQKECTKEVTNVLLGTFLNEIRQRTKMQNYVWRLEFQKNSNVHYHIVTDTYIDYFFALKIWNRILKNHGYVKPYTEKFSKMSLFEYNQAVNPNKKTDFQVIAKRYASGCKSKWEQPNTVDCKSVVGKKAISFYLSKYFSKKDNNAVLCNEYDTPENSKNLRLWFCSRSLSALNSISDYCENFHVDMESLVTSMVSVKKHIAKYATVFYFEIQKAVGYPRKIMSMLLYDYSKKQGYIPA